MPDIEKLKAKRDQINALLQKERTKEQATKRKFDTRAKILAGAAVLIKIENATSEEKMEIANDLRKYLSEKDYERFRHCMKNR